MYVVWQLAGGGYVKQSGAFAGLSTAHVELMESSSTPLSLTATPVSSWKHDRPYSMVYVE